MSEYYSGLYSLGFGEVGGESGKVKMDGLDTNPGYLADKIDGVTIRDIMGKLVSYPSPNTEKLFNCDISVAINDVVYISNVTDDLAVVPANNTGDLQVIGIVKDKPTTTTCMVLLSGIYSYAHNFTKGHMLFLGATGTMVDTAPTTGYLQILGVVLDTTQLLINVSQQRIFLG